MHNFSGTVRICLLIPLLVSAACTGAVDHSPGSAPQSQLEPTAGEKRAAAVELFRLGKEQMRTGDSLRAQEYFATAIDSGGDADLILPELMRAAVSGMRYQAAIRYFEDFGTLMSSRCRAQLGAVVAVLYLGVEQPERARSVLENTLRVESKDARAHFLLGQILREEFSDYVGSDAHFRAYLELEPNGKNAPEARAGLLQSADESLAVAPPQSVHPVALPRRWQ